MAIFRYIAADPTGKEMRGAMDAASSQEVVSRLTARGFQQVQVVGGGSATGSSTASGPGTPMTPASMRSAASYGVPSSSAFAVGWVKPEDQALFFRQMASLLHAGFNVAAALGDLGMRTAHRGLGSAAKQMGQAVGNGGSLASQMAQFPGLFPSHVVGLVAAGETGGFLEFAFEEAALNAEQDAALRQGSWVTSFLAWQSVWSVLLSVALIPSVDPKNPMHTVTNYVRWTLFLWVPVGIALHIGVAVLANVRRQPFARDYFDKLSLSIPVMARVARMRALASFTRVLRRLLMSGISPEPAYAGAAAAVPNAVLRERLRYGLPVLRGGQGIDQAIQATGLMQFDPLQMLVTGQKTGQWLEMLDRVTSFYQEEAARATEDAKKAQRQAAIVLTIVSSGYVLILGAMGMSHMFGWVEQFMGTNE